MFKVGDKVLFSLSGAGVAEIKDNTGIIIDLDGADYIILNRTSGHNSIYRRELIHLAPLSKVNDERKNIEDYFTVQINALKGRLRKITSEEKIKERVKKYNDTRGMILKNCERILTYSDDDEFENRLKEINRLNKILHTINLDCGDILRKENGKVKYDMKIIGTHMNSALNGYSDYHVDIDIIR